MKISSIVLYFAVLFIGALGVFGCRPLVSGPEPQGPGWIDLISRAGGGVAQTLHHEDQTFLGLTLTEADSTVSLAMDLDHPRSLVLGGGYLRQGEQTTREGWIHYQVVTLDQTLVEGEIELPGKSVWWQKIVELPFSMVGPAEVTIEADISKGHSVLIRDALVEQETARVTLREPVPQILLISLDTLREDALGVFGGPWKTPNLDSFAREGERWSPHYSGGGWTKPSHAVMLTGFRVDTHQMSQKDRVLDSGIETLAQRMQAQGLSTGGFVYDCKWLDPKWGFDRGFDEYHVQNGRIGRSIYQISNWAQAHAGQPYFLFFHTFEPHSDFHRLPYESPETTMVGVAEVFGMPEYGCKDQRCASQRLVDINNGLTQPLPNETEVLRFLYGRGVEETDRALGILFNDLKSRGLWDNLLVVITSDHGEAFYEHGRYLHGLMWNEIIRVPFLVKWPKDRNSGRVGPYVTSSIDIGPTLLDHAGLDFSDLPGRPLQRLDVERAVTISGPNRMVIQGDWKAILSGNLKEILFLSNVREDRAETSDLAEGHEDAARELVNIARGIRQHDIALREKYRSADAGQTAVMTEEETAKLKALGYLE